MIIVVYIQKVHLSFGAKISTIQTKYSLLWYSNTNMFFLEWKYSKVLFIVVVELYKLCFPLLYLLCDKSMNSWYNQIFPSSLKTSMPSAHTSDLRYFLANSNFSTGDHEEADHSQLHSFPSLVLSLFQTTMLFLLIFKG